MNDYQQARDSFDAGVLSLGFPVGEKQVPADLDFAKQAFRKAVNLDPDMCDAWLGLAVAGEETSTVWENLYRTAPLNLGRQQRRIGLAHRQLQGSFYTGLFIEYSLHTFTEIWVAYAAHLILEEKYDQAEEVFLQLDERLRSEPASAQLSAEKNLISYVKGVMFFRTGRWPDAISTLQGCENWVDNYASAAACYVSGSGNAQLGMFNEAIRKLTVAEEGPIASARVRALHCHGLILREQGNEEAARAMFERVFAMDQNFQGNNDAMNNPAFRIVLTSKEVIDSRTDKWDAKSATLGQTKAEEQEKQTSLILEQAQAELNRQIGLSEVKNQVAKLKATAAMAKVRAEKGLATGSSSLHLAFTGPPGTGKTTIARIIAKIYCGLGLLATDTVVEATRKDFVGQHLGSTAIKTSALIDSALDGVLFIDEAYTLIQTGLSGGDAFGQEAVDTLLARMENDRSRLVVIIAGYDAEIDRFLDSNEGLASRFGKRIRFPSYSPDELTEIAKAIASVRDSDVSPEAVDVLHAFCATLAATEIPDKNGELRSAIDSKGNGRFVRNVVEKAEEEREFRLSTSMDMANLTEKDLRLITRPDMEAALEGIMAIRG